MASTGMRGRTLLVANCVIAGLAILSAVLNAGTTVWLMTFTIDDGPYAVSGDGLDPVTPGGTGVYKDYRLGTGQPGDVNYCVEAAHSSGLLFIRLNRSLDGGEGAQYCDLSGGSPRQFSVTIDSASACIELSSHGYPAGPGAPCVFTGAEKPRIRIEKDPYAKKTSKTPVAFLSKWHDISAVSYELRTDSEATVATVGIDPSMRIVSYAGSGRLWRFEPGVRARAVAESFPLPFQMTFKRTLE